MNNLSHSTTNLGLISIKITGKAIEHAVGQKQIVINNFPVGSPPTIAYNGTSLTKQAMGTLRSQSYKIPQAGRTISLHVLAGSHEDHLLEQLAYFISDPHNEHTFHLEYNDANKRGVNYSCEGVTIQKIAPTAVSTDSKEITFICEQAKATFNKS